MLRNFSYQKLSHSVMHFVYPSIEMYRMLMRDCTYPDYVKYNKIKDP